MFYGHAMFYAAFKIALLEFTETEWDMREYTTHGRLCNLPNANTWIMCSFIQMYLRCVNCSYEVNETGSVGMNNIGAIWSNVTIFIDSNSLKNNISI